MSLFYGSYQTPLPGQSGYSYIMVYNPWGSIIEEGCVVVSPMRVPIEPKGIKPFRHSVDERSHLFDNDDYSLDNVRFLRL